MSFRTSRFTSAGVDLSNNPGQVLGWEVCTRKSLRIHLDSKISNHTQNFVRVVFAIIPVSLSILQVRRGPVYMCTRWQRCKHGVCSRVPVSCTPFRIIVSNPFNNVPLFLVRFLVCFCFFFPFVIYELFKLDL